MNDAVSRRRLLADAGHTAAAGTIWAAASRWARADSTVKGANDRIGLAVIGCGRRGKELLSLALRCDHVAIPVVCDVDAKAAAAAADLVQQAGKPKPAVVGDFHHALDRKEVDAVIIATPDHWHALQLVFACLAHKDVYVEAPISHSLGEGLAMIHATRRNHCVVQVGLQQRAGAGYADAVQQVQSGQLGKVCQTRTWTFMKARPIARKPDGQPPPELSYDQWLGPAPNRPYNPNRVYDRWENWWDYGGGMVNRWNVHLHDIVHWAMKVNAPQSVVAVGGTFGLNDDRETPDTLEVVFEYQSQQPRTMGPFTHVYSLRMSNGHAAWGPPVPRPNGKIGPGASMHYGTQFHGDQGTLFVDRDRVVVFPVEENQSKMLGKPDEGEVSDAVDLLTRAHLDDFLSCARSRNEPRAPIEAGHSAVVPCHLANIAFRMGRKVYFDGAQIRCFTDPEHKNPDQAANDLLRWHYRSPYVIPPM